MFCIFCNAPWRIKIMSVVDGKIMHITSHALTLDWRSIFINVRRISVGKPPRHINLTRAGVRKLTAVWTSQIMKIRRSMTKPTCDEAGIFSSRFHRSERFLPNIISRMKSLARLRELFQVIAIQPNVRGNNFVLTTCWQIHFPMCYKFCIEQTLCS